MYVVVNSHSAEHPEPLLSGIDVLINGRSSSPEISMARAVDRTTAAINQNRLERLRSIKLALDLQFRDILTALGYSGLAKAESSGPNVIHA
ncbi:hypothetical protein BPAE_0100g00260 [Botrytis paeoniae]|uniref:Uncharacterized protein n=1 Tax=Botrytis paeoniae TaxID=278948 RepID=A0A4Z1FMA1_9HELO|nr:hypothetical protein BPAE_0100g00260 [Botrytis paeoniae]